MACKLRFLIFIVLILSLSSFVSAWGVLPAKQLIDFSSEEQIVSLTLRNNNFDEGFFKLSFAGDLSKFIVEKDDSLIYLSPSDSEKKISFKVKFPKDKLIPGKNTLKIILQQVDVSSGENTLSSVMTLVAEAIVNVPYEGNFVVANLDIPASKTLDDNRITISLINKGESAVNVWADIVIKGPTNSEIIRWTTEKKLLDYLSAGKIETFWKGEKNPGVYFAEVILHYGDKTQVLRKQFVVGQKEVLVEDIVSPNFLLGEINRLDLKVRSVWNDLLDDVFAQVYVVSEDGTIVQTFKSTPENFNAYESKRLSAFWDTSNLLVGNYVLQTKISIDGHTSEKDFPVIVSMNKLSFSPSANAIRESSDSSKNSTNSLLIILLIVVLFTNLMILFYFKKFKKK